MIASVAATTALPNQVVGKIDRPWRQDEPVFLSTKPAGPEAPFATLEDAVQGAAFMSRTGRDGSGGSGRGYEVYGVVREGDAFRAAKLLTPIWSTSWGVDRMTRLDPVQIKDATPTADGRGTRVEATSVREGSWSRRQETITGTLRTTDALAALVGSGWAIVDGAFRHVDGGADPFPPPPPPPPPPPAHPILRTAISDIEQSIKLIETVPVTDKGDASTKDARIGAYNANMAAQGKIEDVFLRDNISSELVSSLREVDAFLEDANWQLAKKPSPDGRFTGVDIPGALRDSRAALELLTGVVTALPADA